jgi:membrane associated rhomboid family serine protease
MSEARNMDVSKSIISARSERQAMDWSLVLVSQGIESVIMRSEDGSWGLVVDAADYEAAASAIRQYVLENRQRVWQKELKWTGLLFDTRSAIWAIAIISFYALDSVFDLKTRGVMDSTAVRSGEWWRLFTAIMLHADAAHLAANVTTGILILGLAMGFYGVELCLLAAYLAGMGGNLAGLLIYSQPHRGLGASGMVMGGLGLLTMQSLFLWRQTGRTSELIQRGVIAGLLLLVLLGFNPASDVIAHVGGFVLGSLFGGLLALVCPDVAQKRRIAFLAGMIFGALVTLTWWLALR